MFNIFNLFERKIKEKEGDLEKIIPITPVEEPILSFIESVKNERYRYRLSVISEETGRYADTFYICLVDTFLKNTYLLSLIKERRQYSDPHRLCPLDSRTVRDIKDPNCGKLEDDPVSERWSKALRHVKISDLSWITKDEWEVLCNILVKELYRRRSIKHRKIAIKKQIRNNKKRKEFKKMYMQDSTK